MSKIIYNRKENGCHVCSRWTPTYGCDHYGPQDADKNSELVKAIVRAFHGDNVDIHETRDFVAGVNATLIILRQNNLIKS